MAQTPHTEILLSVFTRVKKQKWWKPYVRFFNNQQHNTSRLYTTNQLHQLHSTSRLHHTNHLEGYTTHKYLEQCISNLHLLVSSTMFPILTLSSQVKWYSLIPRPLSGETLETRVVRIVHVMNKSGSKIIDIRKSCETYLNDSTCLCTFSKDFHCKKRWMPFHYYSFTYIRCAQLIIFYSLKYVKGGGIYFVPLDLNSKELSVSCMYCREGAYLRRC